MPSRSEGMGRLALEAHGRGRPVVASAVGGLPEVVEDGETGVLVPPDDPDSLADAIVKLLEDPERARAMGRQGRERMQARSPSDEFERGIERLASVGVAMTHVLFVTQVIDRRRPHAGVRGHMDRRAR